MKKKRAEVGGVVRSPLRCRSTLPGLGRCRCKIFGRGGGPKATGGVVKLETARG